MKAAPPPRRPRKLRFKAIPQGCPQEPLRSRTDPPGPPRLRSRLFQDRLQTPPRPSQDPQDTFTRCLAQSWGHLVLGHFMAIFKLYWGHFGTLACDVEAILRARDPHQIYGGSYKAQHMAQHTTHNTQHAAHFAQHTTCSTHNTPHPLTPHYTQHIISPPFRVVSST